MASASEFVRSKRISVEEAFSKIKSSDSIVSALAAAEPSVLLTQLHTTAPRVRDVTVATCLPMQPYPFYTDAAMQGHFAHDARFFMPPVRKAHEEAGTTSYVANHLHRAGSDWLAYQKPTRTCRAPMATPSFTWRKWTWSSRTTAAFPNCRRRPRQRRTC